MNLLTMIILASAAGGLLSVLLASVALRMRPEWVPVMVSYSIGALLGAAFLEILPHALEHTGDFQTLGSVVLAGLLGFFILEKLVLWRHCHTEHCEAHGTPIESEAGHELSHQHPHTHPQELHHMGHHHSHAVAGHGRSGLMITVGDTVHNFVDGVMIAAAFLVDVKLGVVTALAIAAHEVPQELGDFLILLHSGYSKTKALLLNLLSSAAMIVGAILGYFLLNSLQSMLPYILAVAASGMISVAVAALIPGLHKRAALKHTLQQVLLILLGVFTVWAASSFAHSLMDSAPGHAFHEDPQGQHAEQHKHEQALQPLPVEQGN